jgi:hypothetical protein
MMDRNFANYPSNSISSGLAQVDVHILMQKERFPSSRSFILPEIAIRL